MDLVVGLDIAFHLGVMVIDMDIHIMVLNQSGQVADAVSPPGVHEHDALNICKIVPGAIVQGFSNSLDSVV